MLAQRYRLESSLLAIETFEDGSQRLSVLPEGSALVVITGVAVRGKISISLGNRRLEVFEADLAERSSPFGSQENSWAD